MAQNDIIVSVGFLPGRKQEALYIKLSDGEITPLAYFRNPIHADIVRELLVSLAIPAGRLLAARGD